MVNIAVLVSGGGTNLQALIDAEKAGKLKNGRLALVISSSTDAYALKRAEDAGIKSECVLRSGYKGRKAFTHAIVETLRRHDVGLVVLAGFMIILSPEFTEVFENRVLNVHSALIPAFSGKGFYGLHVHEAALASGVKLSGATVHFVNEQCDGGPIILQKAVEVLYGDTPETLQRRVMTEAEWVILCEAVSLFCEGRLTVEGNRVKIG
ncbi:MAG: phosphoribosylglycinamide formyltransferase [Oscillospiraceae bacterium]|jgi:phosphoribosylglycinamide formyltransferase-1|nr:phosphoribosylglycinamide formyltransferase [Oscillospiraceae bacterium]